jgi:Fe-S-cluster containining protein
MLTGEIIENGSKGKSMNDPELIALGKEENFQFDCNRSVPCFNRCCRDLNQALTPHDVLMLRLYLRRSWKRFLERFAVVRTGPATGLPVVSLRFADGPEMCCPFVTPQGCSVYAARPTSCRLYPLARIVRRSPADGRLSEHYAVLKEAHCQGFEQAGYRTAGQWVNEQGAVKALEAGDKLMELIALKNRLRPGPLSQLHQEWVTMAFYDLERLKQEAVAGFSSMREAQMPLPDTDDDAGWLDWGLAWLIRALFGSLG